MGVKYLWTVLSPFCDRKPLYELQGKKVAVDLSCWICEAQNIAEYQVQPRMYLRNLYFRTCYLMLMDVNPVFVLEGKAPALKYDTMSARNAIQFKGAKPRADGVKIGKDRTRFHFVLRQCEEMLGYMGLACIKGNGEAESLCACLNKDGLVDGCISQDSDCFAYGARVVYRNFSISTQGTRAASGGAVDVYDIRKADQSLGFGRNKIIAMALLVGCDYTEGVRGVGKDSALKFFETVSDDEVLEKLRSWRKNKNIYENYEKHLTDQNICTSCGHRGKIQVHAKNGCSSCKTTKGCDPFKYKNERLNMKNEVSMRKKALEDPNFPDEILIKEFLDRHDDFKELDLKWKQPDVVKFLKFTTKFLQWEEIYAFEKILPILTRWQCRNPDLLIHKNELKGILTPDRIKKVRNPKGVPSYEIIWSDSGACFSGLVPESQISASNIDSEKLWSTIEPQNLVENAYPQLVEDFKLSKIKPKISIKRKKKKNDNIDEIPEKLDDVCITESKSKKTRKPRAAAGKTTGTQNSTESRPKPIENRQITTQKPAETVVYDLNSSFDQMTINEKKKATKTKIGTLDDFVKKASRNSYKKYINTPEIIEDDEILCPANATKMDASIDFDMSSFGDESDLDLSAIVDDIVSREGLKNKLKYIADKYDPGPGDDEDVASLDDSLQSVDAEHDGGEYDRFSVREKRHNRSTQARTRGNSFLTLNIQKNLGKFGCQIENDDDITDRSDENKEDPNHVSSFFVNNPADEHDLFEKTFNETFRNFKDSNSGSETEEYEYETNNLASDRKFAGYAGNNLNIGGTVCLTSDDDSFASLSLYERLKIK